MINDWISVEDRLPESCHEVLFFAINESGSKELMIGHRDKDSWTHCCLFYSTVYLENCTITHWMELPEYPKIEESHVPKVQRVAATSRGSQ